MKRAAASLAFLLCSVGATPQKSVTLIDPNFSPKMPKLLRQRGIAAVLLAEAFDGSTSTTTKNFCATLRSVGHKKKKKKEGLWSCRVYNKGGALITSYGEIEDGDR
jgi:hypothetical protein